MYLIKEPNDRFDIYGMLEQNVVGLFVTRTFNRT